MAHGLLFIAPASFVNPSSTDHEIGELTRDEWVKLQAGVEPSQRAPDDAAVDRAFGLDEQRELDCRSTTGIAQ